MTREELQRASEELRQAAEVAGDDVVDRIYDQSNQLATLATGDRDPDHGRLDRHMHALQELSEATEGDVRERVVAAREAVAAYREGVDGV